VHIKRMIIVTLRISTCLFRRLVAISLLTLVPLAGWAADTPKSVFVKASCQNKISSEVVSSLREEIRKSERYRLAQNLADDGQTGVVFTINVSCTEGKSVVAIASVFGAAKCFSVANCHHTVDGSSIRADLCDAKISADCGRTIFKVFDGYVNNPIRPPLKL